MWFRSFPRALLQSIMGRQGTTNTVSARHGVVAAWGDPLELAEYGRAIVRGWWVIRPMRAGRPGSAALATAAATPSYQSSVKFFVVSPPAAGQSALQSRELSKQRIPAYASLVKSEKFIEGLVKDGTTGLSAAAITDSISASADKETLSSRSS